MEVCLVFQGRIDEEVLAVLKDLGDHGAHPRHDVEPEFPAAVAPEQRRDAAGVAFLPETQAHLETVGRLRHSAGIRICLPAARKDRRVFPLGGAGQGGLFGAGAEKQGHAEEDELFHGWASRCRNASALSGLRSSAFW